jgi:hypothetical protein
MALVELFMHGYKSEYQGWAAAWILIIIGMSSLIYFQIGEQFLHVVAQALL